MNDVVDLFPPGAHADDGGDLVVGGCRLRDLAAEFGTPAYVVDEGALRARAREYRDELAARWGDSLAVFASKAFPCTAVLRAVAEEGLGCDVAGAGELVHASRPASTLRASTCTATRRPTRTSSARSTPASERS
jgi:diaminopimelate decarboxylase